jgi:hypothetical protein
MRASCKDLKVAATAVVASLLEQNGNRQMFEEGVESRKLMGPLIISEHRRPSRARGVQISTSAPSSIT